MSYHYNNGSPFVRQSQKFRIRLRYVILPTLALCVVALLWNLVASLFAPATDSIHTAVHDDTVLLSPMMAENENDDLNGEDDTLIEVNANTDLNAGVENSISLQQAFQMNTPAPKPSIKARTTPNTNTLAMTAQDLANLNHIEPASGLPHQIGDIYMPQKKPFMTAEVSLNVDDFSSMGGAISVVEKPVKVSSGDTLMTVLTKKGGMEYQNAYHVVEALGPFYTPQDLRPGHKMKLVFKEYQGQQIFAGLTIDTDPVRSIIVKKMPDGRLAVGDQEKELKRTLKVAKGTIDNSLYLSADKAGMSDEMIVTLIKIYSWSVDFQRDIRKGDAFEVMYEEYATEDGHTVSGKGNILYATLTLRDDPIALYRFEISENDIDYFGPDGKSVRKTLMRTPINGARLSSGFGRRKHPVLGYTKMHKGVDFAAPRGTPIYAAGDGTLEYVGRNGSFGNYIRIRHRHGLKTAYAHLKGFKSGIRSGKRIKQGDVIGYVGTTGRSTGPHLHYEVLMNGRQVNPRTVKLPSQGRDLKGRDLDTFQGVVAQLDHEFKKHVATSVAAR